MWEAPTTLSVSSWILGKLPTCTVVLKLITSARFPGQPPDEQIQFTTFVRSSFSPLQVYRAVKYYYIVESRTVWPNLWRVVNLIHILLILAHWFGCFYFLLSEAEGFQVIAFAVCHVGPGPNLICPSNEMEKTASHEYKFIWIIVWRDPQISSGWDENNFPEQIFTRHLFAGWLGVSLPSRWLRNIK